LTVIWDTIALVAMVGTLPSGFLHPDLGLNVDPTDEIAAGPQGVSEFTLANPLAIRGVKKTLGVS
jgi:hypothetical protein